MKLRQADSHLKLFAAVRTTRAALPYLKKAGGRIVNITTPAGKHPPAKVVSHLGQSRRGHRTHQGALQGARGIRRVGQHRVRRLDQERSTRAYGCRTRLERR